MKHRVKNLHTVPRSYKSEQNGQMIEFAPGEQKEVSTEPPRSQELWQVEAVEQTVKPEDTELKNEEDEGGDNE